MRISYRKRHELNVYDNGFNQNRNDFYVCEDEAQYLLSIRKQVMTEFNYLRNLNLKKRIVSAPVVEKAKDRNIFNKVVEELVSEENLNEKGILIRNSSTYFYEIKRTGIKYFHFFDEMLVSFISTENNINYNSKEFGLSGTDAQSELNGFFAVISFIKYAQIETKILTTKQKLKVFNCKYLNETNSDIEIINSNWFTNLVNSEGFKVRGHFRLQPKKKYGEWTKELIWINEFKKNGYTSPARKLHST